MAVLDKIYEAGSEHVGTIQRLTAVEVRDRVPVLREDYVEAGVLESNAMDIDVNALHQGFLSGARAKGAQLRPDARVKTLERRNNAWLVHAGGCDIVAKVVINAAGAWSDQLAEMAGAERVGLMPKRRTAILFQGPVHIPFCEWPAFIDADEEFYARPESGALMGSPADETPMEPCDVQPEELDIAIAVDRLQRATTLEIKHISRSWAGLRSFVADKTPVVGFDPRIEGFFWTAEQEQMAKAADDTGAVTVGFGRGSIDDLEKVTLLDPKAIQALLDFEVWSDKDMKMLEDLKRAKEQGISVEYDDGGWLGRERVNFGPGMDGSPTNNVGGGRAAELERLSGEMRGARSDEAYRALENEFMKVKAMTPAEFDALTPNAELQDTMNAAAVNPGSIFTHDMHVEKAFQDLFSGTKTLGSRLLTIELTDSNELSTLGLQTKANTSNFPMDSETAAGMLILLVSLIKHILIFSEMTE